MKKTVMISLLLISYLTQGFSQEPTSTKKIVKTTFWVNGVCEMCQTRIQKAALSTKGVKMANWHIESKMLTVLYNPKKCTVTAIKQNIANVGHDSKDIKATNEAYKNLHHCCLYDRE